MSSRRASETAGDDPGLISIDGGASTAGGFSDQVTINAPGLFRMPGTFVPVVDLDGELDATATGEDLPFVSFAEAGVVLNLIPSFQQRARTCSTTRGTDAGGDPVSGFELSSAAGVDWAQPVPEPDRRLGAVVGLGLAALLARSRGRRARPARARLGAARA